MNALREINILLALRHTHIVSVREMVVGSTLDKVYMVMDYYDNDLKVHTYTHTHTHTHVFCMYVY